MLHVVNQALVHDILTILDGIIKSFVGLYTRDAKVHQCSTIFTVEGIFYRGIISALGKTDKIEWNLQTR